MLIIKYLLGVLSWTYLSQISRKDADQFEPGQWIPECQLIVQWEREDQRPVRLWHKVDLIGAKAPYNFFYLTLNPALEEGTIAYCLECIVLISLLNEAS